MKELQDYQQRFVQAIQQVIAGNWLRKTPKIRVLDMGCDCSGRQLAEISRLVRGEVVGINIPEDFPNKSAIQTAGSKVQLYRMDGMNLEFPAESFDLVISANVIEHVPDPKKFIQEASRVLKPHGICYLETAPLWTSSRGHHIMESMIAENCPLETRFKDDGLIVRDWSHLVYDRQQMEHSIGDKVLSTTRDYILDFIYNSKILNKVSWSTIRTSIYQAFPHVSLSTIPIPIRDTGLLPQDDREDYHVYGFHALCRKRPKPWLQSKFCYRLRRLGW
jgi:ubiquinone/menaquinone biosynthesis C-methylase UbiE